MLRKDRILGALRSICAQRPAQSGALRRYAGFSAEDVADFAGVDRTNASRDLNLLANEGKIKRIPGRPVLFTVKTPSTEPLRENGSNNGSNGNWQSVQAEYSPVMVECPPEIEYHQDVPLQVTQGPGKPPAVVASIHVGAVVTSFETLIGWGEGLKVAIQQAKAAMLYPPRGLHTLLCGPSGVGKTTFARLMHGFALELHALPADAPFISFNCADYAGNPQLLMAHLFGVVRGAYTGADNDREGLVEQAHRGILFLDEVHRLPPEGQEMLFYLMDRERFRRMGDIDIQHYFQRFADQVSHGKQGCNGSPSNLVDERIAMASQRIVQYAEEQLARTFPEKLALVLAMHLTSTLEHITHGRMIVEPAIQSVRFTYPIEYEVAQVALLQFRSALGVSLPESETDVLAVLLANADALLSSEQSTVGIVVAAHGRGIAAGLVGLVHVPIVIQSFTVPLGISGFVATGGDIRGSFLQFFDLAVSALIYFPFFRAWERILVVREEEASQYEAAEAPTLVKVG